MSPLHDCPDLSRWRELLAGNTLPAAQKVLEDHLNSCPRCAAVLETLAMGPGSPKLPLERLRTPVAPVEPALERVIQDVSRKR